MHRQDATRAERAIENEVLQEESNHRRHGDDRGERPQRRAAGVFDEHVRGVGREDGKVTVGQVHEAHDAKHQRKTDREERVQPAQEEALHHGVRPHHQDLSDLWADSPSPK